MKLSIFALSLGLFAAISNASSITIADNGSNVYFQENPQTPGSAVRSLGQTFVLPTGTDTVLTGFQFFLTQSTDAAFDYRAYIFQWDTATLQATGPALFTSAAMNGTQAATFTGLDVALTPGTSYIALLTTEGVVNNGYNNGFLVNNSGNVYSGGAAYQQTSPTSNGATGNGSWDSVAWTALYGGDFKFSATFGPDSVTTDSPTPEPSSAALILLGGAAIAGLRRVRCNKAS